MSRKAETAEAPDKDAVAEQLKALAGELVAVADKPETRGTVLEKLEGFLSSLRVSDFPELAESPVVQSFLAMMGGDMKPGEVKARGTLAERTREWTERDLAEFEYVTFIPRETIPITWNGITIQLGDDVECRIPKPFYNIYLEHRKAQKQAEIHSDYMQGFSPVPPDRNWLTDDSASVRAYSLLGPTPDPRLRKVGPISSEEE